MINKTEFNILVYILDQPKTKKQIAVHTVYARDTISKKLSKLKQKGLVIEYKTEINNVANMYTVTEMGKQLAKILIKTEERLKESKGETK